MKTLGQYLGMLFILSFLVACNGGSGGSSGGSSITGVSGTVTDMSGAALPGATVNVGSKTTLSDAQGKFTLSTATGEVSLTAKLQNYMQNSKVVKVESGVLTSQNLKLAIVDTVKEFDASAGTTLAAKGANIVLPTSYVLEDGSAYTGKVTARATYNKVTTAAGSETFPGPFLGQTIGGNTAVLQSYGFIDVTLENSNGDKLNLANSTTATLTYPMDESITDTPATIPLWYFDTAKGIWVEEGEATYDAVTNTYSGTVTHFSTWNLDKKFDGASLKGCIEDSEGAIVPVADIYISAAGWSKTVSNNDATGTFEFINAPSGIELTLIARLDDQSSAEEKVTLTAGVTTTMAECLVLNVDSSELFATITGKLVDGNNTALDSQSVILYSVEEGSEIFQTSVNTDVDGKFEFSVKRSNIDDIKLTINRYFDSQNIAFNEYFSIDPVKAVTDVGSIRLATTTVDACVTLEAGSVTTDGITTLADGTTTVDDGTTIAGTGFTSFGTDQRQLRVDSAYAIDYSVMNFEQTGTFSYVLPQDNLSHRFYAHVYNTDSSKYTLTGSMSVLANVDTIDLTNANECIELHAMKTASKTVSASVASSNSVHLEVSSPSDYNFVSDDPKVLSKSFIIDENGEYIIKQVSDSFDDTVSGTISVTVNGSTQTVTIPDSSNSEFWTGFAIESYDGELTVKAINKNYYQNDQEGMF